MDSIKTRLVQLEVHPGNPRLNTAAMLRHIAAAREEGVQLVVFPEMSVPGYLLGDEWEHPAFLHECEDCHEQLRAAARGITVIFGSVGLDWTRRNEDGRVRKYNALFVADDGQWAGPPGGPYPFVIKTLLPNYREFDDSRHFFDLRKLAYEEQVPVENLLKPVDTRLGKLGCSLCEDAWDNDYALSPLLVLAQQHPALFVNISSSPFTMHKNHKRNRVFSALASRLRRPLVFVNNVGVQNVGKTVFVFDGSSCVYNGCGQRVACSSAFRETALTCEIPLGGRPFGSPVELSHDDISTMYTALAYGTRKFMELCGVRRVVVGISGGIDSSVVAAVYRQLLPGSDLLLVNMPSRYNSPTTRSLAKQLATNLGACYVEISIEDSVSLTRSQIDGLVVRTVDGRSPQRLSLTPFMLENVQARDRSSRILAALAAAFEGVFTCNANKSEATVGYGTLYGDIAGYFANLADVWKTEIYELARHLNEHVYGAEVIPQGCLTVTPSAELSPSQNVDEGKGDPLHYPYHDLLFKSWVEWWDRATPQEILEWYAAGCLEEKLGFHGHVANLFPTAGEFIADLERWWNLYKGMGLAKRLQAPPVLALKRRAFGFDHRESQMGPHYTKKYEELKAQLLRKAN